MKSYINPMQKNYNLFHAKFQPTFPRKSLVTIYISFIRPHLDYDDVVYDRAFNESFHQSLDYLRYSAAIEITWAIRWTLSEKLFQELRLETLKSRCWLRKLCLLYKLIKEKSPAYLFQIIPEKKHPLYYKKCSKKSNPFYQDQNKLFQNFFSSCSFNGVEWDWC